MRAAMGVFGAVLALGAAQLQARETARSAPQCDLVSLSDGQPYRLEPPRGQVVWVDFWASWCGPCAESFPFLAGLDRELRERGLRVFGVSVDEDPGEAAAFLREHP